jgi:parvulin-like peptidyl-prolyl isomerase
MRFLLSLLLICSASVAALTADLADLTVRYVNNEVITMGDIQLRNEMRRSEFTRRGLVLPRTRAELISFSKQSLEDLTDDVLLAQRAKEMGIQANHDEIVFEVLEQAKKSGVGYSLRDQAEQRRHLERQRTIERITGWYESLMPQPRPQDLAKAYQSGKASFNRPSQARILQILVRPTPPEERAALRAGKSALLRTGQDATDAAIKTCVAARLTAFLAADSLGQDLALDGLVTDLAPLADRKDLAPADRTLVSQAADLAKRSTQLMDQQEVKRRLEIARLALTGLSGEGQINAFRELAKRISQGPAATRGGEIGWIEPGLYTKELDAVAFGLDKGELSQVFWVADIGCLLLCADRKDAQIRSFDEVSGEIERTMRWQRRGQARDQAVRILRAKASIRDVNGLDKLTE